MLYQGNCAKEVTTIPTVHKMNTAIKTSMGAKVTMVTFHDKLVNKVQYLLLTA
jgi:hypothetical protein